jgi:hypothetical protein
VRTFGPISGRSARAKLGRDAKLTDWLSGLAADCPRKLKTGYSDGIHLFRIEPDGFSVVGDGAVVVALLAPDEAAGPVGFGALRIDPDRLVREKSKDTRC